MELLNEAKEKRTLDLDLRSNKHLSNYDGSQITTM